MITALARAGLAAAALTATLARGEDPADPAAFLQELSRPESQAFLREQGAAARAMLDALSGRGALAERIHALSATTPAITSIAIAASRVFYLRRLPESTAASLCMREGFAGPEHVLVDPERFSEAGRRASIDWISPSPDGRNVAYGISRGGSEDTLLRVVGADDARDLPFEIDRTRFAAPAWDPDGRAFYYARYPEGGEGAKRYSNIRVYRHVLGRESARDEIVFAPGVGGARDVPEFSLPSLVVPIESRYAYAIVREGTRREIAVHVTERRDLSAGKPAWRKLVAFEDQVTAIEAWKDDLFLLSHREAPRSRVLRMAAKATDANAARVAVPQGDAVVEAMALARDALYLRTQLGGVDRLERLQVGLLGTKPADYVRIPFDTAITQLVADPRRPGAILSIEGWLEAPSVVEVEPRTGNLRNTGLAPPSSVDFSAIDEVRLYATAHDGEKIPVTLLYPKSTRLTGANPTLLVAYGAYGKSTTPSYDPARLAWLERGGVYAIAHVRGGGEYGEAWHQAAARGAKLTSVLDFISVAEYLVSYGFTRPSRLAIMGTGAGAIPVAGALVRRPDRFAAVVARAPLVDLLGYESMPEGPMSVPEFGSAANPQSVAVLRDISAFHQVKDGASYPAVLFSIGLNDSRVVPSQAARMTTRLQAASASGKPVLLRVDPEAGHGVGTPRDRREQELADIYSFLLWQFGDPKFRPQ